MIRIALRSLWSRKLRTGLTVLAILLGVAMIAGTFVLTDQINRASVDIFEKSAQGTDVIVSHKSAFGNVISSFGPAGTLPASMVATVKGVNGVAEAVGQAGGIGAPVVNGKAVKAGGAPSLVYSTTPPRFANSSYVSGGPPEQSGQVAVDQQMASKQHLRAGDNIGLSTPQGVKPVTISGIFVFAQGTSIGGATLVVTTLSDAQTWYNMPGQVSSIAVAAASGVTPNELATRIRAALPATADVKTGQQSARDDAKGVSDILGVLTPALLAFGGIAVIVGAFIIFNAFSITVAQRLREFAMLRSLGASRRQVLSVVVGESLVLGIAASILGILVGLGLASGITALVKAANVGLPTSGLVLETRTIVVALVVGIGVTLVAALAPALRAMRVPPVAALQEGAVLPPLMRGRSIYYLGGAVIVLSVLSLTRGLFGHDATGLRLLFLAMGVVSIFVVVAMLSKYIVSPIARALGWPLEKMAPISGRLARENSMRKPTRTALTAAALMVGLAMVVLVAVFAQSLKSSFVDAIDHSVNASIVLSGQNRRSFPAAALDTVRGVPAIKDAAAVYSSQVQVNGSKGTSPANGVNPALFAPLWRFEWLKGGSDALLPKLTGDNVIVEEQFALSHKLSPGSSFAVKNSAGQTQRLKVIGEYRDKVLMTGFVMGQTTFDSFFPMTQQDPFYVIATQTPGSDPGMVKSQVEAAMKQFPTANVQTKTEFTDAQKKSINTLLYLLYALLAVAVIISIFGIINTLVLSVYERTREIGMLRAVGATRRQMRRIVRYESVITSIIGGILGIVLGLVFAYVVMMRLGAQGISFSTPWLQLVVFFIVAAFVGVLAAVLPARRAANLNILEALHHE
jgi:putative ABC transport system permease protein